MKSFANYPILALCNCPSPFIPKLKETFEDRSDIASNKVTTGPVSLLQMTEGKPNYLDGNLVINYRKHYVSVLV